jgi:hypothetical protein
MNTAILAIQDYSYRLPGNTPNASAMNVSNIFEIFFITIFLLEFMLKVFFYSYFSRLLAWALFLGREHI